MSRMPILSGGRLHIVEVDHPETKTLIGRYWGQGVKDFIETGDEERLRKFRGYVIDGRLLETEPDAIESFYMDTDFDFQEVYEP
jgi:hypothetical protein